MSNAIEKKENAITADQIDAFSAAVTFGVPDTVPPTFVTIYRRCEFEWLRQNNIDLRNLLHTEQEYEWLIPLQVGDEPLIHTTLKSMKERSRFRYIVLETSIFCKEQKKVIATTSFVVRGKE